MKNRILNFLLAATMMTITFIIVLYMALFLFSFIIWDLVIIEKCNHSIVIRICMAVGMLMGAYDSINPTIFPIEKKE